MRHIIWDMGGTLIDTYPEVVRALSRAAYGDTAPSHLREIGALTQYSIAHAIESLSVSRGVPRADLERAYEELKTRWRTRPAPVMDGARELIATGAGRRAASISWPPTAIAPAPPCSSPSSNNIFTL